MTGGGGLGGPVTPALWLVSERTIDKTDGEGTEGGKYMT